MKWGGNKLLQFAAKLGVNARDIQAVARTNDENPSSPPPPGGGDERRRKTDDYSQPTVVNQLTPATIAGAAPAIAQRSTTMVTTLSTTIASTSIATSTDKTVAKDRPGSIANNHSNVIDMFSRKPVEKSNAQEKKAVPMRSARAA